MVEWMAGAGAEAEVGAEAEAEDKLIELLPTESARCIGTRLLRWIRLRSFTPTIITSS